MGAFKKGALIGFGIGYLRGAKAGRPRYEQIMDKLKKVELGPVKQKVEPIMSKVMAKTAGIKKGGSSGPTAAPSAFQTPGSASQA